MPDAIAISPIEWKLMFDLLPLDAMMTFLAQNGGPPPLPGEALPAGNGGTGAGQTAAPAGGGLGWLFPAMLLFLGVLIVTSLLGQRKERKKRQELISSIKKHDKVQTIGGVIGSIVELKPDFVVLKVDESSNTRITFARSAIQQVVKSSDTPAPVTEEGLNPSS